MITPAISVLSAVEGLTIVEASLQPLVMPISIGILVGLFLVQAHGTARVGAIFGPIVLVYFAVLAALGVVNIVAHPEILGASSARTWAVAILLLRSEARLPRHGLGVPRGHRRRDALCRHGPFRPQGDRVFLADARLSRA